MSNHYDLTKIDLSDAIISLVNLVFRESDPKNVLKIEVVFTASNYEEEKRVRKSLNFAIYRPCNYVFVGVYEDNDGLTLSNNAKIQRKSYHDSCWRSDGINSTIYSFIQKNFPEKFREDCWTFSTSFGISNPRLIPGKITNIDSADRVATFVSLEE